MLRGAVEVLGRDALQHGEAGLAQVGNELGAKVLLPGWLLVAAGVVTMAMALLSGLFALRSLRQVEPVALLR